MVSLNLSFLIVKELQFFHGTIRIITNLMFPLRHLIGISNSTEWNGTFDFFPPELVSSAVFLRLINGSDRWHDRNPEGVLHSFVFLNHQKVLFIMPELQFCYVHQFLLNFTAITLVHLQKGPWKSPLNWSTWCFSIFNNKNEDKSKNVFTVLCLPATVLSVLHILIYLIHAPVIGKSPT